jgi:intracellular sulfur oxidation DsrE/DsrF family protein
VLGHGSVQVAFLLKHADPVSPVAFCLAKRGVRFTVCDLSTHAIAGLIADSIGGKAGDIYPQLIANRVDSARQVPAGIVALNRAQEHGYSTM